MFDLWRSGYVRRPIDEVARDGVVSGADVVWLPDQGPFQYLADPFGIERDGVLNVFVEAFDYRMRRGDIRYFRFDAADRLIDKGVALARRFHLSYPSLIEDGGALYMLPEAHKSGALTLYRSERFPDRWAPAGDLLDVPAIDASLARHEGLWWLFYALPGPDDRAMRELHVAWSETLSGPFTPHSNNPVRSGFDGSRPGGTAFASDGVLHLPVQDCRETYGAAIRLLRFEALTPETIAVSIGDGLGPAGLLDGYADGLHTLSGAGDVTCIDVKSIRRSAWEPIVKFESKVRKAFGRLRTKGAA